MADLAVIYRDLDKFTEAEQLLSTVLEKKSSTLGPEHKETLIVQKKLARLQQHIEHHKNQISSDSQLVGK
jgi:hypothetical protein